MYAKGLEIIKKDYKKEIDFIVLRHNYAIIKSQYYEGGNVMIEIRPIKDLRDTTEISKLCEESKEPIYITKNGYGHLVVMSMETYKDKLAKADLYEKLAEAENQIKNGEKLLDAEAVFESLKERYGK